MSDIAKLIEIKEQLEALVEYMQREESWILAPDYLLLSLTDIVNQLAITLVKDR